MEPKRCGVRGCPYPISGVLHINVRTSGTFSTPVCRHHVEYLRFGNVGLCRHSIPLDIYCALCDRKIFYGGLAIR